MPTLADILTALTTHLEGPEQYGTLSADIVDATVVTFTMAATQEPVPVGARAEIDDELLKVQSVVRAAGTDTYTAARGVEGSTATSHLSGAKVSVNPKYPRWQRKAAVNRVLTEWLTVKAPRVLQDSSQVMSAIAGVVAVPVAAINVLEVGYKPPGFLDLVPLRHGAPRPYPTSIASTGRGVALYDLQDILPGFSLTVTYTTPWSALSADTDALPSDFPAGVHLLAAGAAAALLGGKFNRRATFDWAHAQRAEDKAGQAMTLTREARREVMGEFQTLHDELAQTWYGARVPTYWE